MLEADQFGYRSTHFIVKIKSEWLKAPNYRNLENLKAEIQIRTVLMHAWAEIEHKLAYKKKSHIPDIFRRKFSRLSAKLEEADKQFEKLRKEVASYKEDVVEIAKNESNEFSDVELNLDSLQAFLDTIAPNRAKSVHQTSELLDELIEYNISLRELIETYERVKDYLPKMEKDDFGLRLGQVNYAQSGLIRTMLDLTNDEYFERELPVAVRERVLKWRKDVQQNKAEENSE